MWVVFRSYYESSDLPSALSVIEEALARHPDLVSDDFINMAAELYITNRQYNKALQVGLWKNLYCRLDWEQMLSV